MRVHDAHRRAIFFAAGTALFIAGYTVTDGMGARLSGHAVSYVAWLSILDGLPMLLAAAVLRRDAFARHLAARAWKSAAGGALQLTAYGLVVWALVPRSRWPRSRRCARRACCSPRSSG